MAFRVPVDIADEPKTSSGGKMSAAIGRSGRMIGFINHFRRVMRDSDASVQSLQELVVGPTDPTDLLGRELDAPMAGGPGKTERLNRNLNRVIEGVFHDSKSGAGRETGLPDAMQSSSVKASEPTLREALERMPLLVAERTYNTSHPGYDARVVRNFPGPVLTSVTQQCRAQRQLPFPT